MADLLIGRVVGVHGEGYAVDLVMVHDGARLAGVQVLSSSASSNSGRADLHAPDVPEGDARWSIRQSTGRDVIAVVGRAFGQPVVVGFLFPQVAQCLFADKNRRVDRHASDVYTTIDDAGNIEHYHPSGTYLRIGTSAAHEDLTGRDFDGRWKIARNTDKAVHVRLLVANAGAQKAVLDIDPSGNVTLTHVGNLAVDTGGTVDVTAGGAATVTAPTATIDSPSTTCTGDLLVEGQITGQGGMAISGGTGATVAGNLTVTGGDVSADGTGLKSHHHTEQGDGAPTSAAQP